MPEELTKSLSTRVAEVEKQAHEEGFQKREDERKVLFSKFAERLEVENNLEVQNEAGLLDELPVPEVFKAQVIVENQSFIDTTVNSSVQKFESVNYPREGSRR